MESFSVVPIGVVHSPFKDKRSAPRQPNVAREVSGTIELFPDPRYEHALADLDGWSHIWVLFWFHLNDGWRSMVRPPRSARKRGVFSTRAPHRPNPIGLSVLRLERVVGRTLEVRGLDIVDGSPVLDIKPYVPYADVVTDAGSGWLAQRPDLTEDVGPRYAVRWAERAIERARWLSENHGVEIREEAENMLSLGPTPHPYRRIKQDGAHFRLALRDWRLSFSLVDRSVTILDVLTGYRPRDLADPRTEQKGQTPLSVHRAFVERFGRP